MGRFEIDMNTFKRKAQYEYFSSLAYPYMGVTRDIDITELSYSIRQSGAPFFLTILYCVIKAANSVPELRQRIIEDKLMQYDSCMASYTVAIDDDTYCYFNVDCTKPYSEFIEYAKAEQEKAKACNTINCNKAEEEELFFVSSVPWFDYTSVIQPVPMPADGNPRLTWGKYFTRCGRTYLPFTILCNHAIVDGRHLGLFFEALSDSIREVNELLSKQIDG